MRRILETALLAALLISLSVKIATGLAERQQVSISPQDQVAALLARNGLTVGPPLDDTDPQLIPGDKGDCHLLATVAAPFGEHRDVLARLTPADRRLYFIVDGEIFDKQPVWRTSIDYFRMRLFLYAGASVEYRPVLGVIASAGCGLSSMDWGETPPR